MSEQILQAFVDACGGADALGAQELERLVASGRDAWPELSIDPIALAKGLGEAIAAGVTLERLDPAEIALARACAAGESAALRAFDARYLAELPRMIGHMRLSGDAVAEVAQTTRRRLLIANEGSAPRLVSYAGRGQLRALVRVVATRAALDMRRSSERRREVPVAELSAVLLASTDPERAAGQGRKQEVFRTAFEAAIAALPAADRTLLRMVAIDGVGIDGVAAVAGIHRSTAARRLAKVRGAIAAQTRVQLQIAGLAGGELESVIGVIDQGLELTLSRILAEPDPKGG